MIHIYYLLLLVLTAAGSVIATLYGPTLLTRIKRYFTRFKRTLPANQDQVEYLQQQINVLAGKLQNRKTADIETIRKEVRRYLEQLKNK